MIATDELRRLLDDRGVEWDELQSSERGYRITRWKDELGRYVSALDSGGTKYFLDFYWGPTPQQAVDATLGCGTCMDEGSGTVAFKCSECGCWTAYDEDWSTGIYAWEGDMMKSVFPRYCPNCGRAVVKEERDE